MKIPYSLFIVTALAPSLALAQQPSPAQVGISTAVPNVVQVYDSSHNWATIGTIDPTTHLFSPAGVAGVLPIASTTTLGAVKVDGTTITATSGGVISGTPPGITANSTVTNGFVAGKIIMSDGSKVQPVGDNATNWTADVRYPLYVAGVSSATPFMQITSNLSAGLGNYGVGITTYPWGGGGFNIDNAPAGDGFFGFTVSTNGSGNPSGAAIMSDGNSIINIRAPQFLGSANALRVNNTYTDHNNGEWGALDWQTVPNTLTIGSEKNGTGTVRPVNIVGNPVTINGAAIPNGIVTAGTTPTSGFVPGQLMYSDGTHVQPFAENIYLELANHPGYPIYMASYTSNPSVLQITTRAAGIPNYGVGIGGWNDGSGIVMLDNATPGYSFFGFTNHTNALTTTPDVGIASDGYGIIDFRNIYGGVPVQFRVNNIWTDQNNSEWGGFDWLTTPNVLTIGTGANGTGTVRPVRIQGNGVTLATGAIALTLDPSGWTTLGGSVNMGAANLYTGVHYEQGPLYAGSSQIPAVNCAAGTVSLTTLVVTNGIITHC
jgi:hypothetical protein